jgi:hypothetical protein
VEHVRGTRQIPQSRRVGGITAANRLKLCGRGHLAQGRWIDTGELAHELIATAAADRSQELLVLEEQNIGDVPADRI